uniref:Acyl carrier protein n=1 Tax=Candidatus Kentrum sp. UNK TaxID=2126344 RepID=A0A451AXP4_9GAMM|nr:MAG: acyl carrier protein [Candidatus Kentron sp. UNK]VFK70824.1 MAG: acyl carrier protein [Candidatus Kentron sp. UNK]
MLLDSRFRGNDGRVTNENLWFRLGWVGTITRTIKRLLAEVKEQPELEEGLSDDADIFNDVWLDSLQTVTFLFKLEDAFDIEIDFDNFDYADMRSIGHLCEVIGAQQANNAN